MHKWCFVLLTLVLLSSLVFAQSSEESTQEESTQESSQNDNDVDCSQHNDCDSCTDESKCVWCETDEECIDGGFFGPSSILPSCSNWKYKQCLSEIFIFSNGDYVNIYSFFYHYLVNGRWYTWYPFLLLCFILIIGCICGLITFFFCNPCTYAYKQYKNKGAYVRWEDMQKSMELEEKGPTEEQIRRENLRQKWNLN